MNTASDQQGVGDGQHGAAIDEDEVVLAAELVEQPARLVHHLRLADPVRILTGGQHPQAIDGGGPNGVPGEHLAEKHLASAVVALLPMDGFMSAIVNTDILLATIWTAFAWYALRTVRRGLRLEIGSWNIIATSRW